MQSLEGKLPQGTLHARLLTSLSSATVEKGSEVNAIVTQPLFTPAGDKVMVPEGAHMHGVVVEVQKARWFARNGKLRFAFRGLDLPSTQQGTPLDIHGRLFSAETAPDQHVSIDEEGQVKAGSVPASWANRRCWAFWLPSPRRMVIRAVAASTAEEVRH